MVNNMLSSEKGPHMRVGNSPIMKKVVFKSQVI